MVRVALQKVLVVRLGPIERSALESRRYLLRIRVSGVELRDVFLRDFTLLRIGRKNRRSVLRAVIGPLSVELCGIVHNGEKDVQELAEADFGRVVDDLDAFGVTRISSTDEL